MKVSNDEINPYQKNPKIFDVKNLRDQIIGSQAVDKRAPMMGWFENLMDGIERNLLTKNRDRCTGKYVMVEFMVICFRCQCVLFLV